jgi:hypothetical protein
MQSHTSKKNSVETSRVFIHADNADKEGGNHPHWKGDGDRELTTFPFLSEIDDDLDENTAITAISSACSIKRLQIRRRTSSFAKPRTASKLFCAFDQRTENSNRSSADAASRKWSSTRFATFERRSMLGRRRASSPMVEARSGIETLSTA